MSADALQKIFKVLGDPTRVRILFLLEREELAVQELMDVLGMAQSRVSRHLGILREAGLLTDRRDGTFVLYRYDAPTSGDWADAWALSRRAVAEDPGSERDLAALARVVHGRTARSRSFFEEVGPEWDALRKVWGDDMLRAEALHRLVPPDLVAVDVGTGTGALARELADAGLRVIAVDHSETMLAAAREKFGDAQRDRIELRTGDAATLPLADAEADAAFAHMVLQYLASPAEALAEMARVVKPGGAHRRRRFRHARSRVDAPGARRRLARLRPGRDRRAARRRGLCRRPDRAPPVGDARRGPSRHLHRRRTARLAPPGRPTRRAT